MMYMVFPTAHVVDSAKLRATVDHATNNKHILLTSIVISSGFVTLLAYSLVGPRQQCVTQCVRRMGEMQNTSTSPWS